MLHGRVVDMLYFPLMEGTFPDWFPFWANQEFLFFRPVFNIADSSITVGVMLIILFQRRFFAKAEEENAVLNESELEENDSELSEDAPSESKPSNPRSDSEESVD